MTDRGCEQIRAELEEYLHNELQAADAEDIRKHMTDCVECSNEFTIGVVLTEAVRRACSEVAPEELRMQVLASIRRVHASHE